jgi:hypothetical protein
LRLWTLAYKLACKQVGVPLLQLLAGRNKLINALAIEARVHTASESQMSGIGSFRLPGITCGY